MYAPSPSNVGFINWCVKTEASKRPVPMDPLLAAELWAWKQHSSYSQPYDWVFASPRTNGKNPYWPDIFLSRVQ